MAKFASQEEEWKAYLVGAHPSIRFGQRTFRHLPSSPRCKFCSVPYGGLGRVLFGRLGFEPWDKNPNICRRCVTWLDKQEVSGAEVEITFLFADVRRSSTSPVAWARWSSPALMQRFYAVASDVLIADEAIIEKSSGTRSSASSCRS